MNENPLLPASYDILWSAIVLTFLVAAIWALVSLSRSAVDSPTKLAWAVFIIVAPVLGALVWLAYRRKRAEELAR